MHAGIYKPGQGYWVRLMSAIAFGTLVLMGSNWVWGLVTLRIEGVQPVYLKATAATLFFLIFGGVGFWLLGLQPRVVDFLIATEAEMKKVNWSSRREIIGSTWVVIGLTVFIAALTFVVDLFFQWFFQSMGVLETAT